MSATGAERAAARYKKSAVALLLAAAAMYAAGDMYLSNFVLQVTYTDIRLRTLPPGFAGFRICHLSDLHGASFGRTNGTLMRKIASENPDIICITGDFADSTRQLEWAAGTLAALRDIAPVYYVTGNHEWGAAPGEGGETLVQGLRRLMADLDCVYLDNGHVTLERDGGELIICGLVDPNGPADSLLVTPVINKARAQGAVSPLIVLSHRHDRMALYAQHGMDLVLAGHTHGGVVRLPLFGGLVGPGHELLPKYAAGLHRMGSTQMYVSRGLGGAGPRLFNRPEVAILTLRGENTP